MRRERACLDQLPLTTSELLGLRAGLSGAPVSRADAAAQLAISTRRAARLERRGLEALHSACGGASRGGSGSAGGTSARLVSLATGAPALQPAVYLPASDAPDLEPASDLDHPRGKQDVKGATASSPPASSSDGPVAASATPESAITEDTAGNAILPIILAACLAMLAALLLFGLRRRAVAHRGGAATITRATSAPAPIRSAPADAASPPVGSGLPPDVASRPAGSVPAAAAAATGAAAAPAAKSGTEGEWAGGPAPSPAGPRGADAGRAAEGASARQSSRDRAKRSASVVASGLVSFAVRELVRRRRGR